MLGDDEDVFDSVTWESPATQAPAYDVGVGAPSGPGFRQSTAESEDGRGPHDPKWEGYLITSVKDPVKELAETKDAYVSYLVTAKVCTGYHPNILQLTFEVFPDEPTHLLHSESIIPQTFPGLRVSKEQPCERLSCMCGTTST